MMKQMLKKSRKSGTLSMRKRSRYEDAKGNHDSSSPTGASTSPYVSPFANYFRQSRELVPFQGFNSSEEETDNQVVDANPIISNEAAPVDALPLQLAKGSEYEDFGRDASPEVVHNVITKIVKSVLSLHQSSTPELPKDPVRVFGHRCGSSTKVTSEMNDAATDTPTPITDIIPVAEIAGENCPQVPLADLSSSACAVNSNDQPRQLEPTDDRILIEESGEESNQPSRCSDKSEGSVNVTEMVNWTVHDDDDECSSVRDTVETVEGYTVRKEFATTLRLILAKHGDIAANCSFQIAKYRSFLLEQACEIFEKLDALDLKKVTPQQLKDLRACIIDLEPSIDLEWLKKRVEDIMETKSVIMKAPVLKAQKVESNLEIEKAKKTVEEEKKVISALQKVISALQEKVKREEENLADLKKKGSIIEEECLEASAKVKRFHNKPLVRDLLRL